MRRLIRRLRGDHGFTMVSIVTGMMVVGMFSLGAYTAALGDIQLGRKDQDRKRAAEAAKAGVEWYAYHLFRDPNHWTYCDDPGQTGVSTGISLQGMGRPASAWRNVPSSAADFQVELMTADGTSMTRSQCLADPGARMLDGGVLKVRSTGRSRGEARQIVVSFRRNTFLDYLWYTNWEHIPPEATSNPSRAATECDKPRSQRTDAVCGTISFAGDDEVLGPMHTEDQSFNTACGATFGRYLADNIEVMRATSPSTAFTSCSTPNVDGTKIAPSQSLDLPPSNSSLASVATHTLSGQSCVTFNGDGTATFRQGMSWSGTINCSSGGTVSTVALGTNAVIYVKNSGACTNGYDRYQKYPTGNSACGDVAVSGTYTTNVTIGAQNDIVVRGDTKRAGTISPMLGLIATKHVRIYHPALDGGNICQDGHWETAYTPDRYTDTYANTSHVNDVEAAILALNGSFLVDNWDCGDRDDLGYLRVFGNIAQYWRGAVGNASGKGYLKDYEYDDRLRYRQPPAYLDPELAAWRMLRQSEQSPVQ